MRGWGILAVAGLLSGCQLSPIYAGGGRGPVPMSFADVAVAPIPDRAGWLVGNELRGRLGEPGAQPRYRLEVALDDTITGFGIRGDNSIARERRTLRARYRLVAAATGAVAIEGSVGADLGIDRVSSDFAVVAAETSALERLSLEVSRQIVARLALFFRQGSGAPPAPATP